MTPSFRLDGRRAVVVGASRGIGQACAVALAEEGAHVVLAARSAGRLEATAGALSDHGRSAEVAVLDATDLEQVRRFFSENPPPDVLVNAVGIAEHRSTLEVEPEDYDKVMESNTRAAFFLSQSAARAMRGRGGGSIINISSQMGLVGGQDRSTYAASKHAIEGMTKSMAIDLAKHSIRINTICPTFVRTELTEDTFNDPEKRAWIKSKIKLGDVARVEDVMGFVVVLASDAARMVTGTHILIDGGWTAG